MRRAWEMWLVMSGAAVCCMAGGVSHTPEIDPSSAGSAIAAITLVAGALLLAPVGAGSSTAAPCWLTGHAFQW